MHACIHVQVSGVSTMGMDVRAVAKAIQAARQVTQGGLVVLHLSETGVDTSLLDEAAIQMAGAAAQLLGSRHAVEAVQQAVTMALTGASAKR